jgi:hypothetical protein
MSLPLSRPMDFAQKFKVHESYEERLTVLEALQDPSASV